MQIAKADDVVRTVADLVRERRGEAAPEARVEVQAILKRADDVEAAHRAIANCVGHVWIKHSKGNTVVLTQDGYARFKQLQGESQWGRVERFVRRESKVRGVTWGVVLQGLTLLVALAGVVLSLIALLRQ